MFDSDIGILDLNYLGLRKQICAGVVPTRSGFALVDCGPGVTLNRLQEGLTDLGLALSHLHSILLTHIHLDHAGGAGTLARLAPQAQVYVHGGNGAPHLVNPERLLNSARRLYGDRLEPWFGPMEPIAESRVTRLAGGESLDLDGRRIEVIATPGHASHHLAYVDAETRTLFAGDAAGLRAPGSRVIIPYTPPPDIDLEAWRDSLARMRAARPAALFLAHFGVFPDAVDHLERFEDALGESSELARAIAETDLELDPAGDEFERRSPLPREHGFESVTSLAHCGRGLVRYWRKRAAAADESRSA
jgi:glyoxylase-like metal-dependent hydrolase (beta-lactamase superfamily II)